MSISSIVEIIKDISLFGRRTIKQNSNNVKLKNICFQIPNYGVICDNIFVSEFTTAQIMTLSLFITSMMWKYLYKKWIKKVVF